MKKTILLISFLFCLHLGFSQTFKAYLATGLNASQIEGDKDAGYNKVAVNTGIGVGFNLSQQWFLSTEFLYSRRGSRNAFISDMSEASGQIVLDYIDLPIIFRLGDWYQEKENYNKVWIEGGASVGRLINARIDGSNMPEIVDEFLSTDVSLIGGLGYNINQHFFVNLRYTRSLYPLYRNPDALPLEISYFTSYFLTLRVGYTL